jgi:hypothetical protein
MSRSPWYRAMTGCLQTIPLSDRDVDVETGEMESGELRERPFLELARVLTGDQQTTFVLLAVADIAVWPEVEPSLAPRVANALHGSLYSPTSTPVPTLAHGASAGAIATAIASNILPAIQRAENWSDVATSWNALRKAAHEVLRRHPSPVLATSQWLRRITPLAVQLRSAEALRLARDALSNAIGVPEPWIFGTSRYDPQEGAVVELVSPRRPSTRFKRVARFSPYRLEERTLRSSVVPLIPLDWYRLSYLFRSSYLEDSTRDAEFGGYDTAVCEDPSGHQVVLASL